MGKKSIHGVRFKHRTTLLNFFIKKVNLVPYVVFAYSFKKYPYKEFVWGKSLFGQIFPFLQSEYAYPGFRLLPLSILLKKPVKYTNQLFPLYLIPINTIISFVFNTKNQHMAFAKSSGANAVTRKLLKKQKLIYIELPSALIKLFPVYTFCLLAPTSNYFLHKIVEGGWGVFTKQKKVIHVRGVAKNPVDHPNGGRTKAKQPELSPWGWVAKLNK